MGQKIHGLGHQKQSSAREMGSKAKVSSALKKMGKGKDTESTSANKDWKVKYTKVLSTKKEVNGDTKA